MKVLPKPIVKLSAMALVLLSAGIIYYGIQHIFLSGNKIFDAMIFIGLMFLLLALVMLIWTFFLFDSIRGRIKDIDDDIKVVACTCYLPVAALYYFLNKLISAFKEKL